MSALVLLSVDQKDTRAQHTRDPSLNDKGSACWCRHMHGLARSEPCRPCRHFSLSYLTSSSFLFDEIERPPTPLFFRAGFLWWVFLEL